MNDTDLILKKLFELERRIDKLEGEPQSKDEICEIIRYELASYGLIDRSAEDE